MAAQPDGKTKLLNLINKANSQNLPATAVILSLPRVNTDPNHPNDDTAVDVTGAFGSNMTQTRTMFYSRTALSDWAAQNAPNGVLASSVGIGTVAELLTVLNNQYNAGFSLQDFADAPLPTPPQYPINIVLNAVASSYEFTGSLVVMLSNDVIPIGDVLPTNDLGSINPPASGSVTSSGSSIPLYTYSSATNSYSVPTANALGMLSPEILQAPTLDANSFPQSAVYTPPPSGDGTDSPTPAW